MLMISTSGFRPHILFVGAFPPDGCKIFGGNVTACRTLLESTFPDRVRLTLIDSTQVSNPPPPLARRSLLAFRRFLRFLVSFERDKPDAVILFTSVGASIIEKGTMAWYARFRGTPALIFPRGGALMDSCSESQFTQSWVRLAFGGANKVLCQGKSWQRFATAVLRRDTMDAPIVTNWTATPALLKIGSSRKYRSANGPTRILFLGWLEDKKGVLDLIRACGNLAQSRDLVLNLVGDGSARQLAQNLVCEFGLEERVNFHGWLQGDDVEHLLADADMFVLPSWAEGLPNAMIEAMATGLPVIISAVGNIPDVVTNDQEAILVPPKNVSALQKSIARIIDDPQLGQRLGQAGHLLSKSEWSVEPAVNKLIMIRRNCIH